MTTETSSLDDLLMSAKNETQPAAPEHQPDIEDESNEPAESQEPSYELQSNENDADTEESNDEGEPSDYDDYGNAKAKARTYTESEVNERINKAVRERMARFDKNNQVGTQQQQMQQQVSQDFNYNPEGEGNWQQQLESFVEQTFNKISHRQINEATQRREAQAQAEFEDKFTQGMDKFGDFREVVGMQPITDPMTLALRGLSDPASFIYAASKNHSKELQRISQIPDHLAQIVEMGKLEERMRKNSPGTKAPRPISPSKEDASIRVNTKKDGEPSIEDLIAKSDAKRRAQRDQRRGK